MSRANAGWRRLEHRYGITEQEYYDIGGIQGHRCRICQEPLDYSRPHGVHVDHCHARNVIRGLLCGACNRTLGHYESISDWVIQHRSRIDRYLVDNLNLPMPEVISRPIGRPPLILTLEEIAEREQRQRNQKKEWARRDRARKKGQP